MVIFISYRRDDSQYIADRIYEYLVRKFGLEGVSKDLDSIPLGQDFSEVIKTKVGQCDVLLAVIGDKWLAAANPEGKRRIDDPGDWVRLEIEAALDRKVPVIPLLVNGAVMPRGEQLPASVGPLANRNGMPVRPNPDFPHDMGRLIEALSKIGGGRPRRPRWLIPAAVALLAVGIAAVLAARLIPTPSPVNGVNVEGNSQEARARAREQATGLVAFYTFDDGTARDVSGNGNNGTLSPNPPNFIASGYQGGTFLYEPSRNNFISIPVNINPDFMPQITMGGWFNASATTDVKRGLISHDDGNYDRTLDIDSRGSSDHFTGFDLRLMSSLSDVSGIPRSGTNLVIVAKVKGVLYFRILDADGKVVVDTDETRLTTQAGLIEDLKWQLDSLWPPHELTSSEKDRVIAAVTSIVDHTHFTWSAFTGSGVIGGSHVAPNRWTFVAMRQDQNTGRLVLDVDGEHFTATQVFFGSGLDTTTIGRNPSFDRPFYGRIDNVFIFSSVLSDPQISDIRANGSKSSLFNRDASLTKPEPVQVKTQ